MNIHANGAKYRLERWRGRTGWDPFTLVGLATSVIALGPSDPVAPSPLAQDTKRAVRSSQLDSYDWPW